MPLLNQTFTARTLLHELSEADFMKGEGTSHNTCSEADSRVVPRAERCAHIERSGSNRSEQLYQHMQGPKTPEARQDAAAHLYCPH